MNATRRYHLTRWGRLPHPLGAFTSPVAGPDIQSEWGSSGCPTLTVRNGSVVRGRYAVPPDGVTDAAAVQSTVGGAA